MAGRYTICYNCGGTTAAGCHLCNPDMHRVLPPYAELPDTNWAQEAGRLSADNAMLKLRVTSLKEEARAERDMKDDERLWLRMVAEKLGVPYEPHQTWHERILEAADKAAMRGWRTMDVAPRDGTSIVLYWPDSSKRPWQANHDGYCVAFWSDPSIGDTTEEDSGWYQYESDSNRVNELFEPTLWMALPVLKA